MNEISIEAVHIRLDGFVKLLTEDSVGALYHVIVCHHVIIEVRLYDVLTDHSADIGAFVEEWEISLVIQIEVCFLSAWLPQ